MKHMDSFDFKQSPAEYTIDELKNDISDPFND